MKQQTNHGLRYARNQTRNLNRSARTTSVPPFAPPLPPGQDTLVYVFLRGGMDGLSLCVPHGDPDYAALRPTLAIPAPGQTGGALPLDGFFGLNPNGSGLLSAYQAGDLAFVQTVGSTDPSLSHFDAMKFIEGGFPNQPIPAGLQATGWLGRHLATSGSNTPMRALALDELTPLTLAGYPFALPMPYPPGFTFGGYHSTRAARRGLLGSMYNHGPLALRGGANATLSAIDQVEAIDFDNYVPSNGALYPDTYFGEKMKHAAIMLKADIGIEVIEADYGGWDDHESQGANSGPMADRLRDLTDSLGAFYTDLGTVMDRVTLVAMSEFGRRVEENGSQGTDHGRGGCFFLMGSHVNGGQVFHDWQGLTPTDLDDGSLQVRLDYRNVMAEVLTKRMGGLNLPTVFPNHTASFYNILS